MNIKDIYPKLNWNKEFTGITCNSKQVRQNFIFVAIKGAKNNGEKYIKEAIENGASIIISEKKFCRFNNHIKVRDAKLEYIKLLKKYYNYNNEIDIIGITGTDGKTTTSVILNNIFNVFKKSALIGTNGIYYLNKKVVTPNTTPAPNLLYPALKVFQKHDINNLVIEISSEGILDKRIEQLQFKGAIFTNLSNEHLNTHKTMTNYFNCKSCLFKKVTNDGLIAINTDDYYAHFIQYKTKAYIISYGLESGIYQAKNIRLSFNYSSFDVYYKGKFLAHFKLPLFGKYNIYNALAAISYSYEDGIDLSIIKEGIENLEPIEGRFMHYIKNDIAGIVDFAHTPNALANLYESLKLFKKNRIIHILGAQGLKDRSKRSLMSEIVINNADITIFTSEDPKTENPFQILQDLTKNLKNKEYYITLTRNEAINLAVNLAKPNDIILITGKGNENTEKILNYTFKHNDMETLKYYVNKNNT